jgi:hypothetical protein
MSYFRATLWGFVFTQLPCSADVTVMSWLMELYSVLPRAMLVANISDEEDLVSECGTCQYDCFHICSSVLRAVNQIEIFRTEVDNITEIVTMDYFLKQS